MIKANDEQQLQPNLDDLIEMYGQIGQIWADLNLQPDGHSEPLVMAAPAKLDSRDPFFHVQKVIEARIVDYPVADFEEFTQRLDFIAIQLDEYVPRSAAEKMYLADLEHESEKRAAAWRAEHPDLAAQIDRLRAGGRDAA